MKACLPGHGFSDSNTIVPIDSRGSRNIRDKNGLDKRDRRKIEEVKQDLSGNSLKPESLKEVWFDETSYAS